MSACRNGLNSDYRPERKSTIVAKRIVKEVALGGLEEGALRAGNVQEPDRRVFVVGERNPGRVLERRVPVAPRGEVGRVWVRIVRPEEGRPLVYDLLLEQEVVGVAEGCARQANSAESVLQVARGRVTAAHPSSLSAPE